MTEEPSEQQSIRDESPAGSWDWHLLNNTFAALMYDLMTWRQGAGDLRHEIRAQYAHVLMGRLKAAGVVKTEDAAESGVGQTKDALTEMIERVATHAPNKAVPKDEAGEMAHNIKRLFQYLSDDKVEGTLDDAWIESYQHWVQCWFHLASLARRERLKRLKTSVNDPP